MSLIADFVLIFHFGVVILITFGFLAIPIGYKLGWSWIGNTKLRLFHSGLMAFITLETLLGLTCPLTAIEHNLRGIDHSKSFVAHWIGRIIYWDFSPLFFILLYCLLLILTIFMWKLFPPNSITGDY